MDKYGFLIEDDGCSSRDNTEIVDGCRGSKLDVKRWENILDKGPTKNLSPSSSMNFLTSQAKVKYYARRGLPDSLRQKAWTVLTGVELMMSENEGRYRALVAEAEVEYQLMRALEAAGDTDNISKVGHLLEVIERDIRRTFPKHFLFHSGDHDDDSIENMNNSERSEANTGSDDEEIDDDEAKDEIADIARSTIEATKRRFTKTIEMSLRRLSGEEDGELLEDFGRKDSARSSNISPPQQSEMLGMGHGQDALRNVLRAYSLYDGETGYCQGMNFIAAMFLTFLSEEESFWLLVVVMNREPYKIRDLFGEDMAGTHEVLYIAEKLMNQFLPELSAHMEKENVHVTMFVTQWLVTLYVREFPFDLVARVWDSFLVEGWKVIYRVMLSLMEEASRDILGLQFEGILHYLRDFPSSVNGQAIMARSLKIPLKRKHIQKHATEWRRSANGS